MKTLAYLILPCFCLLLSACLVLPKTTEVYDADCQIMVRQAELEVQQAGAIGSCRGGQDCVALLALYGIVGAGSAVISGSIVVVGKVVYWFEKQGRCLRSGDAAASPAPAPL